MSRSTHFLLAAPLLACTADRSPTAATTWLETTSSSSSDTDSSGDLPTEPATTNLTTAIPEPTTSSSISTETTNPLGFCGDSTVDADEQCDLGSDNSDDGRCTLDCELAICGDGKLWLDVEQCDLAGDNDDSYSGCSPQCTKNAHCGDSIVDVPFEQCDAGPANGTGQSDENSAPCTLGCRWDARIAFLSSELYDADLGGLDGADQKCRTLGKAAGLQRWDTLMAWLSSGELGPLDRFVLLPTKPYVLPTGERIADSLADLVLDGPGDGIRVDETGKPIPPSNVWTNTSIIGEPYDPTDDCSNWDSAMSGFSTRIGLSHVPHHPEDVWKTWQEDKRWTNFGAWDCFDEARLYCFEQ